MAAGMRLSLPKVTTAGWPMTSWPVAAVAKPSPRRIVPRAWSLPMMYHVPSTRPPVRLRLSPFGRIRCRLTSVAGAHVAPRHQQLVPCLAKPVRFDLLLDEVGVRWIGWAGVAESRDRLVPRCLGKTPPLLFVSLFPGRDLGVERRALRRRPCGRAVRVAPVLPAQAILPVLKPPAGRPSRWRI